MTKNRGILRAIIGLLIACASLQLYMKIQADEVRMPYGVSARRTIEAGELLTRDNVLQEVLTQHRVPNMEGVPPRLFIAKTSDTIGFAARHALKIGQRITEKDIAIAPSTAVSAELTLLQPAGGDKDSRKLLIKLDTSTLSTPDAAELRLLVGDSNLLWATSHSDFGSSNRDRYELRVKAGPLGSVATWPSGDDLESFSMLRSKALTGFLQAHARPI